MAKPIRLGVVGGNRGRGFGQSLATLKKDMILTAICDLNPGVCASWKSDFPGIQTYTDYERLLDSGTVDAILIATPMQVHVSQSVAALRRGIHVASEVTACNTIAEGRQLILAVEGSKAVYFFAENYCYSRLHMMLEQMCHKGVFGEISYVSGSYYHDCLPLMFDAKGQLTWRGEIRRDWQCNCYPTHSLGPIDRWLGIREGRDRLVSVSAHMSRQVSATAYCTRRFGRKSPYAQPDYFKLGDTVKTLVKTEKGTLIDLLFDTASPRVGNCAEHFIAGTGASFHSNTPIPYEDGMRAGPGICYGSKGSGEGCPHYRWEPLMDEARKFEHPLWRKHMQKAERAGHGGGDYFILMDFVNAIRGRNAPAIDVYDGVLWSSLIELSAQSIHAGGKAIPIPEFRPKSLS
jgi:predicted dehydrogenase